METRADELRLPLFSAQWMKWRCSEQGDLF